MIIPCGYFIKKEAQIIHEESLSEEVTVYEDAIPFIRCEIQSTIQHESGHRKDQEGRDQSILEEKRTRQRGRRPHQAQITPFPQFSSESRVEPFAEKEEEDCNSLLPPELSGATSSINLTQIFEEAKTAAKIPPQYKVNVRAGHLPPEAQGMFLMRDREQSSIEELIKVKDSHGNVHIDEQDNLWVDVRKIATPFIVQEQVQDKSHPATYQEDGINPDVPGVSQVAPTVNAVPAAPGVSAVPPREVRDGF